MGIPAPIPVPVGLPRARFLLGPLGILVFSTLSAQTTYTVNTTDDQDDGVCDAAHCSLREALTAAASASEGATVAFSIPGPGPHTFLPTSELPAITDHVTVDGTTEPDFSETPVIEIDGSVIGGFAQGLVVIGSDNTIRGLAIHGFDPNGIEIAGSRNTVEGCFLGLDVTGTLDRGNINAGVLIGGADNVIGGTTPGARNVISGNAEGVTIVGVDATSNAVLGNYIGTDRNGTSAVPNNVGVLLLAPDNVVGGATPGAGNVISGNTANAVNLNPPDATGNLIAGNYIGVDATGTSPLGNDIGVWVNDVADNVIGGMEPGARNVISGNREGITFWEAGATGNVVKGNYIGTNAAGDAAIPNQMGIPIYSPGNTIGGAEAGAGNLISGNTINGVNIFGIAAGGNAVLGNYVGTDASGGSAIPNGENGIAVLFASSNTIGGTAPGAGNVVSGNTLDGVVLFGEGADDNVVQGNYLGTDVTGAVALGNGHSGVHIDTGTGNLIGGTGEGARNILSGNDFGITIVNPDASGNVIRGNYIGVNADGDAAIPNLTSGILLFSNDNTIGGTEDGAGNVISGNMFAGIDLGGGTTGTLIQGNQIGTDATGTVALGNDLGLFVNWAPDNTIGGTEAGAGNVISGNHGAGINVNGPDANGNVVQGNLLGPDIAGQAGIGNGGSAITFFDRAHDNTIGGSASGAGNVIAFNGLYGVELVPDAGSANLISGNRIFGNEAIGIDLGSDGVTPNDDGDGDSGPNDLQNWPELLGVASDGGAVVKARLSSLPSSSFTLEFFSSQACDDAGSGEGETVLGSASLSTDASGLGTVMSSVGAPSGPVLTATAIAPDGSTSEFSPCVTLTTFAVAASPQSRTVAAGQTAMYTVSVSAQGGDLDEPVSLACSGAPSGTTCTFSEDELTPGSGQASTGMTVTTVAPASLRVPGPAGRFPGGRRPVWLLILSALILLVYSSPALRRRPGARSSHVVARRWSLAATALALTVGLSCGDDGTTPLSGGTTPGTYELTVTASWESVAQTATATLIVE